MRLVVKAGVECDAISKRVYLLRRKIVESASCLTRLARGSQQKYFSCQMKWNSPSSDNLLQCMHISSKGVGLEVRT